MTPETLEAVVETGQLFAVVPAAVLDRLAVGRIERHYVDAEGQRRGVAQVRAQLDGHSGWITVVFGESDGLARIGRHTLDAFMLDYAEEKHEFTEKVLHEIRHY